MKTKYVADDGVEFYSECECRAYETENLDQAYDELRKLVSVQMPYVDDWNAYAMDEDEIVAFIHKNIPNIMDIYLKGK